MKRTFILFTLISLLGGLSVSAQAFEGIIKYSLKMDMKSNNEEMAMMGGMMPTDYTMYLKGENHKMKLNLGFLGQMDVIHPAGEKNSYIVSHMQKSVFVIAEDPADTSDDEDVKVTPTNEYLTIQGYKCRKYIIEGKGEEPYSMELYASKEVDGLSVDAFTALTKQGNIQGDKIMQAIEGFPMKIVGKNSEMSYEMTCTEIKKQKLDDSEFQIPKNYQVQKMSQSMMPIKF